MIENGEWSPSLADEYTRRVMKKAGIKRQYLDRIERELRVFGTRIIHSVIQVVVFAFLLMISFWAADWSLSGRWLTGIFLGLLFWVLYEMRNFALIFRVRPEDLEELEEN